jgi:hypothetical protein
MSLLDTASLIVTPNGYKEGKLYSVIPSDGSGDLSVTRATTATRVNSAGLVELVPYNLVTYSEQFDNAAWAKSGATISANTTIAPNGTLTADSVTISSLGYLLQQLTLFPAVSGQSVTLSVYAKTNISNFLIFGGGTATGTDTSTITDVGGGWYRHTITRTFNTTTSLQPLQWIIYNQVGTFAIWGAQIVEGSTAKDYQKTETRLNIPRLDYSNGTCPSLLVEPQRTNLNLFSEQLNNAAYSTVGGAGSSVVVSANYGIAPDGNQTADRLQITRGTTYVETRQRKTTTIGQTYTLSFWGKAVTGTPTLYTTINGSYQNPVTFTNEWVRYTHTFTAADTSAGFNLITWVNLAGTSASADLLVWGVQLELGSYATSYIPTTSASVTRNADVISKTGISSLIGQTEGTCFVDFNYDNFNGQPNPILFSFRNTAWTNEVYAQILASGGIQVQTYLGGVQQSYLYYGGATNGHHKLAYAYKQNDFVLYVDGVQIATDTSGNVPATDDFCLGYFSSTYTPSNEYNAAALWKTRLTNTQLAQLTSI